MMLYFIKKSFFKIVITILYFLLLFKVLQNILNFNIAILFLIPFIVNFSIIYFDRSEIKEKIESYFTKNNLK